MTGSSSEPDRESDDTLAERFLSTLCHDAAIGDRPAHLEESAAFYRTREGAGCRAVQHYFVRGTERFPVNSEDLAAQGLGQFSYSHWPERVLSCMKEAAEKSGSASALCVAAFDEEPLPRQWRVPITELAVGVNGHGHAFERWVIAPDMRWAVTIDGNGVLRVFGSPQFVSDFARQYREADETDGVIPSAQNVAGGSTESTSSGSA